MVAGADRPCATKLKVADETKKALLLNTKENAFIQWLFNVLTFLRNTQHLKASMCTPHNIDVVLSLRIQKKA